MTWRPILVGSLCLAAIGCGSSDKGADNNTPPPSPPAKGPGKGPGAAAAPGAPMMGTPVKPGSKLKGGE